MKRDMDLVRKILLAVEKGNLALDGLGYNQDQIYLHVELMKEHGLVKADIYPDPDGTEHQILLCSVERLTWEGHDFLDKARNESIWEQAKKKCLEETGGLTIETIKVCLVQVAKQVLRIE